MTDKKILRLLIIDDSPDDAELASTALRKGGYMLKTQRVQDLSGMQAALDKGRWDTVISEYSLPHFSAQMAHDVLKKAGFDIPFIVFTRNINDADLIKIMRAGAHDVVMKNQTVRLAPVIEREVRVADERRSYRQALKALNEVENKHRAIIEGSREAICYSQDGMHINANKAYLTIFGYESVSEMEGIPVMNLIDKSDQARFKDYIRKSSKQASDKAQEFMAVKKDGARFHVEITLSPITIEGENCTQMLVADISKRKAVENKLHYLNQHDPLTGLYNRHYFIQEIGKSVEKVKREGGTDGVIYIDLNQVKSINNEAGHAAGDRFLLKVVRLVRDKLDGASMLSRFGGDEFAVLVHDTDAKQLKATADSLVKALKNTPFSDGGRSFEGNCTFGTTLINSNSESAHKILSEIYHVSEQGKATKKPEPPPPPPVQKLEAKKPTVQRKPSTASTAWQARIQTALDKDGFELTYQPIINLHGDPAEYFEVLVRLVGDNGELVPAGKFMSAAEHAGQTDAIDRWVVRNSIEALSALHQEGRQASFFINLCSTAFKDAELLPLIKQGFGNAGLKPEYLIFEIDEPAVIADLEAAGKFVKAVKQMGCYFCIDNFGSNLNTLNHLRELPIEYLKIEGSLIRDLASDNVNQASLKAVLDVAKALDKKTIAKFVEAADNLATLWNFGVDYVQGNYFQQADSGLGYEFSGETTLSSDHATPQWASSNNGR